MQMRIRGAFLEFFCELFHDYQDDLIFLRRYPFPIAILNKASFIKFQDVMMNNHAPLRDTLAAAACQLHGDASGMASQATRWLSLFEAIACTTCEHALRRPFGDTRVVVVAGVAAVVWTEWLLIQRLHV